MVAGRGGKEVLNIVVEISVLILMGSLALVAAFMEESDFGFILGESIVGGCEGARLVNLLKYRRVDLDARAAKLSRLETRSNSGLT